MDPSVDRTRITVSIPTHVLDVYWRLAQLGGVSLSRCVGDWLADTADGASLTASKMRRARAAPRELLREIEARMRAGEPEYVSEHLKARFGDGDDGGPRAAGATAAANPPPSSNTGGKSPPRGGGRSVDVAAAAIARAAKAGPRRGRK